MYIIFHSYGAVFNMDKLLDNMFPNMTDYISMEPLHILHNYFMRSSLAYSKWHHKPYANFFHWFLLFGIVGLMFLILYRSVKQPTVYSNYNMFTAPQDSRNVLGENLYVIFITPDGFEPSYALINKETIVLFENISSQFASITFNKLSSVSTRTIEPGKAFQFRVPSVVGRHEYYNTHNPAQKGVLEVSEY